MSGYAFRQEGHFASARRTVETRHEERRAMKGRESGMPAEEDWESYFDSEAAIEQIFDSGTVNGDVVDFGCGYGTFTIPAAARIRGTLTALDIDPAMVGLVEDKAAQEGLANVRAV